ncbi:outer membrane protein assembly factor BamD [Rhodobacteraceae bacterium NNCM2]|nr:outer membrane protein assembly factor BamD [Coraliihabitans acroporae]
MRNAVKTPLVSLVLITGMLAGCSSIGSMFGSSDDDVPIDNRSAREIFQTAEQQLDDGNGKQAAETFNEVERLYPFSQLSKRAVIMSAYASYEAGDYPAARASANRYLDLYPSDVDAPYAQYLIGLTYYDNIVDVGRDQATTEAALQSLQEVVRRYPESEFARDAQLKIDLTNDHLAAKEMEVGRYYLKRGFYSAAINRFRVVIDKYQTTNQTPEALHRIVEANLALGLDQQAVDAAAVLGNNFAGSEWYANSYALLTGRDVLPPADDDDGFFSRAYRQVFEGKWL